MKEKISYLTAAFIIYFVIGLASCFVFANDINWQYIIFWTIAMTLFDYFLLRKIKSYFFKKE